MSEIHFNTLQDALQHANDRIDVALARTIQLEAITDAHHALLSAVAATHPDPLALREEWRRILHEGTPQWVRPEGERLRLGDGRTLAEAEATYLPPCDPTKMKEVRRPKESAK